jgi:hypothetical protein
MAPRPVGVPPADRLVIGLLTLVTIDALICLAASIWHRNELMVLLMYTVFAEIVLAIATLRRRGGDPRWLLYSLSGVILVCAVIDILSGIGLFGFFAYVASDDQANRTQNSARFFQLAYPIYFMRWTVGWRLLVSATGWITFVWSRSTDSSPEMGGPPSLL